MAVCPIHTEAMEHPACMHVIGSIAECPLCHKPMCPVCQRHNITQLSRVTGYIQDVIGWNIGKQQELKDRKHYNLR